MIDNEGLNKKIFMMSNLSFDHSLSDLELFELQNLLLSPIQIGQIYFKDNIDVDTIEKIKLLLEGLPNINDAAIEKYIMKDLDSIDKEKVINMNFMNVDSWNISYSQDGNKYMVTSLTKYRKIEEWFNQVLYETENNKLSLIDKMCVMYDKVKMLEFDNNDKYDRIPEIINDGKATTYGYNLIFKELLLRCGISSMIEKITNKNENNYITLAIINDKKYKIDGIYCFDPSMDTIYKNQYKNNLARKMNYNFFGISIEQLKKVYSKKNMDGLLKIVCSDDIYEFHHLFDLYQTKKESEVRTKEKIFSLSLEEIYNKANNTIEISNDKMITIMTKSLEKYPSDIINKELLTKAISDNYSVRNKELFTNEYVKKCTKLTSNI